MYGYSFNKIFKTLDSDSTPTPASGSFLPLSWSGDTSKFESGIDFTIPNTFNSIKRTNSGTTFVDVTLESDQTIAQGTAFTLSGDIYTGGTDAWYSIGQEGLHTSGISFGDLEFALRLDFPSSGSVINVEWWESGTKITTIGTIPLNSLASWVIEYDGANNINVTVDNGVSPLTYSTTSSYTTENLAVYLLARDTGSNVTDHLALKTVSQPNRLMLSLGDSITFGGAAVGGYSSIDGSSYVAKTVAYTNHRHFACPILAVSGKTSAQVLSEQASIASDYYNVSFDSNLATVMCGINDLRIARSAALINADLDSIVSSLQTDGFTVVILTVIRDHSTADYADRAVVNSHIIAGNTGADYVCDLTGTTLETDTALFEADLLHPNPAGMTVIADKLWLITKDL